MDRKILHLDMDCFYAAIEMRDFPFLKGKPMAVGGSAQRGVLTTCNYEARKFGCRSAMPTYRALELCPQLIVVPTRFEVYRREAQKIREIMQSFTPKIEPLSLDEAFLDVTELNDYAWTVAKRIRQRIFDETGLTASAGVAPNKLLAKIASDWRKPNGQFAIRPEEIDAFMKPLAVNRLWGIGPKTTERLEKRGIRTCADVQALSLEELEALLGSFGRSLYRQARGIDTREVDGNRIRKSLSNERTFGQSLQTDAECREKLGWFFRELQKDLEKAASDRIITKLVLKMRFDDFQRISRERSHDEPDLDIFFELLDEALRARQNRPVRLLGLGVRFADETDEPEQLELEFGGSVLSSFDQTAGAATYQSLDRGYSQRDRPTG